MNKVIIMGRFTKNPSVQYTSQNLCIAKFNIAVQRKFKKENGTADFINCTAFGKLAELISKFFEKGKMILIEGRIQTGKYEHENKMVYTTEVIAESFNFTGDSKKAELEEFEFDEEFED